MSSSERTFAGLAWALAVPATVAISALGFRRTTSMLAGLFAIKPRSPSRSANESVGVDRGAWLVRAAFRNSLVRGGCLPESLVQYGLHAARGQRVKLLLGVRRSPGGDEPVAAHAWVEAAAGPSRDSEHAVIYEIVSP